VETKKDHPLKKIGLAIGTVIAILTGITSLLVFLTGKSNLPEIIQGDTPTFTPSATPSHTATALLPPTATATPSPTATCSPTPTARHSPTATRLPLSNGMAVYPPSDGELTTVVSIWSFVQYRELLTPGTAEYTATVKAGSPWMWDWSFCASKANFFAFVDSIVIRFRIDGYQLREGDHLRVDDGAGQADWLCRRWWTVLSEWPRGDAVQLEIHWTVSKDADDGVTVYPAGEYRQRIIVIAE